jgi:hypothetical protein
MPENEGLLLRLAQQMAQERAAKRLIEMAGTRDYPQQALTEPIGRGVKFIGPRQTTDPRVPPADPGFIGPMPMATGRQTAIPKYARGIGASVERAPYIERTIPQSSDFPSASEVAAGAAPYIERTIRVLPPAQQAPPLVVPSVQPMREGPMLDGLPAEALFKSYADPAGLDVVSSVPKQSIGDILALEARKMQSLKR